MELPYRIGYGFDVHQLSEDRDLWLGGVKIEHEKGLLGHSDADVALHALSDAILGALALGDIGVHFPPTDDRYKGIDSKDILRYVVDIIKEKGYIVGNVDITIMAERPKINPHVPAMVNVIKNILQVEKGNVSIKATTTERLGFTGREEGIASSAVALLIKI